MQGQKTVTGKVAWFHETRGFGFIHSDDGSRDVFVHITAIQKAGMKTLIEGQRVEFDVGEHNGKRAAVNLQIFT
jgi:CspA family cold shock protein